MSQIVSDIDDVTDDDLRQLAERDPAVAPIVQAVLHSDADSREASSS